MSLHRKQDSERSINLDGPDGNAYALMSIAKDWSRQLGLDEKMVIDWMKSGDYDNLLAVFEHFFGRVCRLESRDQELLNRVAAIDLTESKN
jgi:hypothetical protein